MYLCIFCIKQKDTISGLTNNTFDVIVPYLLTLQETELAEGEEKTLQRFPVASDIKLSKGDIIYILTRVFSLCQKHNLSLFLLIFYDMWIKLIIVGLI